MLYVCIFSLLLSTLWISKLNMEAFKKKLDTVMRVNHNRDVEVMKRKYFVLFQLTKNGFGSVLEDYEEPKEKGNKTGT